MTKERGFRILVVGALVLGSLSAPALAGLVVGVDDTSVPFKHSSPAGSGSYSDLFSGYEAWGMTFDGTSLWANAGSTLRKFALDGTLLDTLTTKTGGGVSQAMVGLAWAGGLYGTLNISDEGVYSIDATTGVTTLELDYADGDYDFGGFAYNPFDGLFYGTNDDTTPASGLYSLDVFGAGTISLIASYPMGETDIDGLAIGDNTAYLVTDQSGSFYSYDLSQGPAGSYSSFAGSWSSTEVFASAAFVPTPEPGAFLLFGFGAAGLALIVLRRRSHQILASAIPEGAK